MRRTATMFTVVLTVLATSVLAASVPAAIGTSPENAMPLNPYAPPTAIGTSPENAMPLNPYAPPTLSAGNLWYLKAEVSPDYFEIPRGLLSTAPMRGAEPGDSYRTDLSGSFKMVATNAPEDWDIELESVSRVYQVTDIRHIGESLTVDALVTLELIFSVDVPETASAGLHIFWVNVEVRDLVRPIRVDIDFPSRHR